MFPGRVKNRACVLDRIEDACRLQTGDILIVKSVDTAWSPYFPIVSGLVTEIGGIISHGTWCKNTKIAKRLFNRLMLKYYFRFTQVLWWLESMVCPVWSGCQTSKNILKLVWIKNDRLIDFRQTTL